MIRLAGVLVLLAAASGCVISQGPEQGASQTTLSAKEQSELLPGFSDALLEGVDRINAGPGHTERRRWLPRTAGSIRVVGFLQKLACCGSAEVSLLADGEEVWRRELASGDAIRHAFDIVAYDLNRQSALEVVVSTAPESDCVQVKIAFQVIPEPFVSRWRSDLPAGFPAFSEQERETLRQKGQDSLQKIREASASGQRKITLPPGDYLFHACWSRASTLSDLADLEICAEGVTFWFEPELVHGLLFENCRNVTLRGLTIDCTIPCWLQARITEVDRDHKTIHATLMDGYPPRNAKGDLESEGNRSFMFYDEHGAFINHRHTPGAWRLSEDGARITCQPGRHGIPEALQPGHYLVGTIRTGATLRSVACSRMRYEAVNIWSSPGMAVYEGGGEGGHIYERLRATRRPHTNRLHAFGADVFHLAGTDRGPTLERCESAYAADDNLNIHGSFGRVVERVDERRYYLQGAYEAGDTLEFRDMNSIERIATVKAASVEATPDGPAIPINDQYTAKGECLVELDKPLEAPPLSLVVLDGKRSASGFVLRNCWLHDSFQRTLINGSPGGLIENTTLQNVGYGICIQFETWGPWMEGPFARDLVIRNCRFINAPPSGPAIAVSMHPAGGGSNHRRFEARPVTNMTISGNFFSRSDQECVSIHNVNGLRIHDNSLDQPELSPGDAEWLYLQDCENVSVARNLRPQPLRQAR